MNWLVNFLFPEKCILCGTKNKIICENCFAQIRPKIFERANMFSFYDYREKSVNKLLWNLKYHHSGEVASAFAETLGDFVASIPANVICLIPIPLSSGDRRIHNHAGLVATAIKNYVVKNFTEKKVEVADILIKTTKKKQAHTASKSERLENIKNKIHLKNDLPIADTYIVVDDIFTTGATLNEAREVIGEKLGKTGKEIFAITIAH